MLILNTGSTLADTQKLVNSCGMGKISHPMGLRLVSQARLTGVLATNKGRDPAVSSDIIVLFCCRISRRIGINIEHFLNTDCHSRFSPKFDVNISKVYQHIISLIQIVLVYSYLLSYHKLITLSGS